MGQAVAPAGAKRSATSIPARRVKPSDFQPIGVAPRPDEDATPAQSELLARIDGAKFPSPTLARLREISEETTRSAEASYNVRRGCNAIKQMSMVVRSIIVRPGVKADVQDAAEATRLILDTSRRMCDQVIQRLAGGEAGTHPVWVERTILLTTTEVATEAWKAGVALDEAFVRTHVDLLVALGKSDVPYLESEYQSPEGSVEPVRLTLLNALTPLMSEVKVFNFFHGEEALLEHAAEVIFAAAQEGLAEMAPKDAPRASRTMLLQNLITNGARVYTGAYEARRNAVLDEFDAMSPEALRQALAVHCKGMDLEPIDEAFRTSFGRLVRVAQRMMNSFEASTTPDEPSPTRPRSA